MTLVERYGRLTEPVVVGLISGTSADGVDAVKVHIRGRNLLVTEQHCQPIPGPLRELLFRLFEDRATVREVARANVAVGELFAQAALAVCHGRRPDLIASHGQTVAHLPEAGPLGGGGETLAWPAATLQIGEPAVIAARTGCLTVADFRPADMALGGQAAPLVPFFDQWLLYSEVTDRLAVNLGGIANVTWIPRQGEVLGWDTGPANMLMDALAEKAVGRPYDEGGQLALSGQVLPELLEELLGHPYFARPAPKSTGREEFGRELAERICQRGAAPDVMRTAAVLTAESLVRSVAPVVSSDFEVVVGGGGAANPVLMQELEQRLRRVGATVVRHFDDFGVPSSVREAAAFALFGHLTVLGQVSSLPAVTGASRAAVLGKICLPPP